MERDNNYDWTSWHFPNWISLLEPYRKRAIRVLEIGSWEGRSALFFLHYLPRARLTCVDTFEGGQEHRHAAGRSAVDARELRAVERRFDTNTVRFVRRIEKIKAHSVDALASLGLRKTLRYDIAYIDGSHRAADVYSDAVLTWPLMARGGIPPPRRPSRQSKVGDRRIPQGRKGAISPCAEELPNRYREAIVIGPSEFNREISWWRPLLALNPINVHFRGKQPSQSRGVTSAFDHRRHRPPTPPVHRHGVLRRREKALRPNQLTRSTQWINELYPHRVLPRFRPSTHRNSKEQFEAARKRMGFIPNSMLIMQRNPKMMKAYAQLSAAIWDPTGKVDLKLRRLISHVASRSAGCQYCMAHTAEGAAESLAWSNENSMPSGVIRRVLCSMMLNVLR